MVAIMVDDSYGPDAPRVLGPEVALALLARSIEWGHASLAVVRLSMAVRAGADVPTEHWRYCREAVGASQDPSLVALFRAAEFGSSRAPVPSGPARDFNRICSAGRSSARGHG